MKKYLFCITILVSVIKTVLLSTELEFLEVDVGTKKIAVGLIFEYQFLNLKKYAEVKENVIKYTFDDFNFQLSTANPTTRYEYKVKYPAYMLNLGAYISQKLSEKFIITFKFLTGNNSGEDKSFWEDSLSDRFTSTLKWQFIINSYNLGVGYNLGKFIINNSAVFTNFCLGLYTVTLQEETFTRMEWNNIDPTATGEYHDKISFNSNTYCIDFSIVDRIYLNRSKNVSLDVMLGYTYAMVENLGNYTNLQGKIVEFDFSGIRVATGLSISF